MANTALNVTFTDANSNEQLQKTLTDINPAATNAQLKAFAQSFYGLSDDTYVKSNRVDRINCDTEESGGTGSGKRFRETAITGAAKGSTATITANIREGGTSHGTSAAVTRLLLSPTTVTSGVATVAKFTVSVPNSSGYIYVGLLEDTNFYADFVNTNVE